ncbi:MAG: hypothetical protein ACP5JG_14275, partial [Anaerolineae bacterium]
AYEIRKQAYWTQLAGGYHVYGHNDAWTAPERWREWIDAPGSHHLCRFREIITAIDGWWTLEPDPALIVEGAGGGNTLNVAARAADGNWILAYVSEPATVKLRLTEPAARSGYRVQVIQPATGERLPPQAHPAQTQHTISTPSGWDDALVLFEALA